MMKEHQLFIIRILAILLAALLTVVSIFGVFVETTYSREVSSMAAQGVGQDLVNLFIVSPLLLVSLIFMEKNSKTGTFIFGGTVLYVLYTFVIYSFGVHFNNLFLLYCLILGCSLYLFILYIYYVNRMDVKQWFEENIPVKTIGGYFFLIALIFYFLWLSDILPAIINDTIPESVMEYDLLVNPVHVLDLAVALPALIITAILLIKKNQLGYILTPVLLVFTILLTIALAAMIISLQIKKMMADGSIAGFFVIPVLFSTTFLILFLRRIKRPVTT